MARVYIDFDHTISPNGYRYTPQIMDKPPYKGCVETIQALKEKGHDIIIYSCRANPDVVGEEVVLDKINEMTNYLIFHKIPYDSVFTEKPDYDIVIDDKAIRCNDNWPEIKQFLGV